MLPIRTLAKAPPGIGAQEMRRIDQWATREFQLPPLVMMENAGRALAELVWRRFDPAPDDPIVLLVGKGGNAAGVLAAGRHLAHRGHTVTAALTQPASKLREEARRGLAALRKEGGTAPARMPEDALPEAVLYVDGLIGYGLTDAPDPAAAALIRTANAAKAHRIANDVPSGLHPDTGMPHDPTFRADATLALGLPKEGTLAPEARAYVGELYLADVMLPRGLYADYHLTPEGLFGRDVIVRLPTTA